MREIFNDSFLEIYPSELIELIKDSILNELKFKEGAHSIRVLLTISDDKYIINEEFKDGTTYEYVVDTVNKVLDNLEDEMSNDGWMIWSDNYKVIFELIIQTKP